METSGKTGENINEVFRAIAEKLPARPKQEPKHKVILVPQQNKKCVVLCFKTCLF